MASDVLICNAALQLIKHSKSITALTQGTKEANACEVIYEELRDALLSMHDWNFATRRVKLARVTETPAFGWDYGYQLPADYLRFTSVHDNDAGRGTVPYKIEGNQIMADASDLYLRYVRRETDPNTMIPLFRVALSKLMASRLAVALTQSVSRSNDMYKQFTDDDLPTAKSADAIQDYPEGLPESNWITARYQGRGDNEVTSIEGVD